MKTFEEIDVFIPTEESKDNLKTTYNIFLRMLRELAKQADMRTYISGENMQEYAPEAWHAITKDYSLKLFWEDWYNDPLMFVVLVRGDGPICCINVDDISRTAMNLDAAAYTLTVAFINSLKKDNTQ